MSEKEESPEKLESSGGNVKPSSGKKKEKNNLRDVMREGRKLRSGKNKDGTGLYGMMTPLSLELLEKQPKKIGLIYDEKMLQTHCIWDPDFPEKPDRLKYAWERCQHYGLIERCQRIPARIATKNEILLKHTEEYHDLVESSKNMTEKELMNLSSKFDGIYFHPETYDSAAMAAGSAIEIVEQVVLGKIKYGFSLTRPPGHHAMENEACGYCFFNNVAIAAEHALEGLGLDRIVIVDWDVHHGQGSQYMFYDDPRVTYFSIHRYEFGGFWPSLRQSDYDYIGKGRGRGYNINVPFNKIGMTDGDYMAIMQQILMPLLYEINPQLIIISNGYDAAIGDPEGSSEITPACYAHFIHMMKSFGGGKLAVILEGGYCLKSLAEGVALALRCLLGDPCPMIPPLKPPMESTVESILQVVRVLRPYWKSYCYHQDAEHEDELPAFFQNIEIPKKGIKLNTDENKSEKFELVDDYCKLEPDIASELDIKIDNLIAETKITWTSNRTCLVYDELMRQHKCTSNSHHPERPDRITRIYEMHEDCGLLSRCKLLKSRIATREEILLMHGQEYVDQLRSFQYKSQEELHSIEGGFNSVYLSQEAYESAALALGSTLNVVDEVLSGKSQNGVAIVRPPGHHAENHTAMGFCFFNTVACAARYAQRQFGIKRVLILDWDVHHGNGTQHMFEDDPSVLYISLHRHDHGWFFPVGPEGDYDYVGVKEGEGYNINIPWNKPAMGDAEYIAAFLQVVMPVAYEFAPELVLVSAGFDAARGDPLGGFLVSPECFGHMTHMLSQLAGGKVVLVLEGGYNLNSISSSMAMCTSVLLGDLVPSCRSLVPCVSAAESIRNVLDTHQKYWKSLRFRVLMPTRQDTKVWLGDNKAKKMSPKSTHGPGEHGDGPYTDTSLNTDPREPTNSESDVSDLTKQLENITVEEGLSADKFEHQLEATSPDTSNTQLEESELGACGVSGQTVGAVVKQILGNAAPDDLANAQLFAVNPLSWCPHLEPAVCPLPVSGLNVNDPCQMCQNIGENWVCLTCYQVHCSRFVNEHMVHHSLATDHRLVLSYADLSVWCYACDSYVHNEILSNAKAAAELSKFG